MMYAIMIYTAVLAEPGITAHYAGKDSWWSPFIASQVGFLTLYIVHKLHKLYPGLTVIQYGTHIVGKAAGKLLGLLFLGFYIHLNGLNTREYSEFIVAVFLPRTPIIVVIATILLVAAYSVRGGVESVARSAFILTITSIAIPMAISLLLIPDLDFRYMFPMLEHGVMPMIRGAYVSQAWYSEVFLVSFYLPFVSDSKTGPRWGFIAILTAMLILTYANLVLLCLYNGDEASMMYPILSAYRYISVGGYIENLESVIMTTWVMGNLVKISVFYYAIVLGTAQWLKLSDYRPLVLPMGLLLTATSIWGMPSSQSVTQFVWGTFPVYATFMQTIVPLVLLLIAVTKLRARRG